MCVQGRNPVDGDYLLADVYIHADPTDGPLVAHEGSIAQLQRLEAIRLETPAYIESIFAAGTS
jgi:hypothetical protein